VGGSGEPNNGSSAPPPSQSEWRVPITGLTVPSNGNATISWMSTNGLAYDVYSSSQPPGSGGSWSKLVDAQRSGGNSDSVQVAQDGEMRFYQVVPKGMEASDRGVWGIVRKTIPSSLSFMSPPLTGSDRDFGGELGATMAEALPTVGSKIYIMSPGTGALDENGNALDWIILERVAEGWTRFGGGQLPVLEPGQGFMVENSGEATAPTFSGPVGNSGTNRVTLAGGSVTNPAFNIIGLSEGMAIPASTAFTNVTVVGDFDENKADQVVMMQPDGSWRRLIRRPDGTWYDTGRPNDAGETDLELNPGSAYYYIRRGGEANVDF
jgi:hypothetical protein